MSKNDKNKNLNEKDVEKVSSGCCNPKGCIPNPLENPWRKKDKNSESNFQETLKNLKPFLEDPKNKNLNEKDVEKISGGKDANFEKFKSNLKCTSAVSLGPMLLAYGAPEFRPDITNPTICKYGGPLVKPKEKQNIHGPQNLKPFHDTDKNSDE